MYDTLFLLCMFSSNIYFMKNVRNCPFRMSDQVTSRNLWNTLLPPLVHGETDRNVSIRLTHTLVSSQKMHWLVQNSFGRRWQRFGVGVNVITEYGATKSFSSGISKLGYVWTISEKQRVCLIIILIYYYID